MKKLTILGSTGSIGIKVLDIIKKNNHLYSVTALVAEKNIDLIFKQCIFFRPKYVAMYNISSANILLKKLKMMNIHTEVFGGEKAICELASLDDVDQVVSAIVGFSGLLPTLSAIYAGKIILLANKEALVASGKIFMQAIKKYHAKILPIDSEHNAIFQILPFELQNNLGFIDLKHHGIKNIILTGSGGPFLKVPIKKLNKITPKEACNHPNWSMGKKISVDSATMINKGFEYIEACWLFNANNDRDQIEIIIHPESIIHSMIRYCDGSIMAQLSVSDMAIPISYAMSWPKRINTDIFHLNFHNLNTLTFLKPDFDRYPCLKLTIEAYHSGQSATTTLNASNEIAVHAFLNNKIRFTEISNFNMHILDLFSFKEPNSVEDVMQIDKEVRLLSYNIISKFSL